MYKDMLLKYREYFEKWLNIPIGDVMKAQGIILSGSGNRRFKPDGWRLYLPVCAFMTENALIISCIPEWKDELEALLKDASITDAIEKMKMFSADKALYCSCCKFFGLERLNTEINTTRATLLNAAHLDEYSVYYRKTHATISNFVNPEKWIHDDFDKIVDSRVHYCAFVDGKIVSATDSEDLPNKPDKLVHIGINTLPEHRWKGYASSVCAAFISDYLKRGILPVWNCDLDNTASEALANKLGFKYVGNEVFISSLINI